jgi:CheY-like chemotaxis protein
MPERASVAHFEDNLAQRKVVEAWLEELGHRVIATALTYDQGRQLIPQLATLGAQFVIMDGNLSSKPVQPDQENDGDKLTALIKALPNPPVIIGNSGSRPVVGADINFEKNEVKEIAEYISSY